MPTSYILNISSTLTLHWFHISSISPPYIATTPADLQYSSEEMILPPGGSKTLQIDAADRTHCLQVRVSGYAWSAVPLHTERDKKSTIDLYEESSVKTDKGLEDTQGAGAGAGGVGGVKEIKLSLRSHSTSRPIGEESSLPSPSLSSMLSPSVASKMVTEIVIYTEGALIDRTGLRLKLRATRKGAFVERHAWRSSLGVNPGVSVSASEDSQECILLKEPSLSYALSGRILYQNIISDSTLDDFIPPGMGTEPSPRKMGSREVDIGRIASMNGTGPAFTPGSPPNIGSKPLNLDNFMVQSRRVYEVLDGLRVGDALYTDRAQLKWSYLPPVLRWAAGKERRGGEGKRGDMRRM
jgi:hypothetical protein